MPKVLHVVTNVDRYADGSPTGLWLGELVHVWDQLAQAGIEQEIASPKGGKAPLEPRSLTRLMADKSVRARHEDPEFMALLDSTSALGELDWQAYDAIYLTGGHAVMYDFPGSRALQQLIRDLDENGRIVASVCHGYAGFLEATTSDGRAFVDGKSLTGFSWAEEVVVGVAKKVPYNVQERITSLGALYQKARVPMAPKVVQHGRLITGQNPTSAKGVGKRLIAELSKG